MLLTLDPRAKIINYGIFTVVYGTQQSHKKKKELRDNPQIYISYAIKLHP
jgi:hypothetical protein